MYENYDDDVIVIHNIVNNYSDHLIRFHLISGGCLKPLPFEINPVTRDNAVFAKTGNTARGSIGVFTYDLSLNGSDSTKKMAIMFSVPYDFNLYSNWHAVWECSTATKYVIMSFTLRCITKTTVILCEGKPLMAVLNMNTEMLLSMPQCQTTTPRT